MLIGREKKIMEIKTKKYSYVWWKRRKKLQLFLISATFILISVLIDILLVKNIGKESETLSIILVIQSFFAICIFAYVYNTLDSKLFLKNYKEWNKQLIGKIKQKSMKGNIKWIN